VLGLDLGACGLVLLTSKGLAGHVVRLGSTWRNKYFAEDIPSGVAKTLANVCFLTRLSSDITFYDLASNQVGLPAELKHINKRRKRN
jgi:hypothetical protein